MWLEDRTAKLLATWSFLHNRLNLVRRHDGAGLNAIAECAAGKVDGKGSTMRCCPFLDACL